VTWDLLARTYQTTAELGETGMASSDQYLEAVDGMNTPDSVVTKLCAD
jgi:hypothetical protein